MTLEICLFSHLSEHLMGFFLGGGFVLFFTFNSVLLTTVGISVLQFVICSAAVGYLASVFASHLAASLVTGTGAPSRDNPKPICHCVCRGFL